MALVPLALWILTSVFGMGTGVTSTLTPPQIFGIAALTKKKKSFQSLDANCIGISIKKHALEKDVVSTEWIRQTGD